MPLFGQIPNPPSYLDTAVVGPDQIDLSWENVSNETSYTLYINTADDTNSATNMLGTGADITQGSSTGLQPLTQYYFWVRAYNAGMGGSGFSPAGQL